MQHSNRNSTYCQKENKKKKPTYTIRSGVFLVKSGHTTGCQFWVEPAYRKDNSLPDKVGMGSSIIKALRCRIVKYVTLYFKLATLWHQKLVAVILQNGIKTATMISHLHDCDFISTSVDATRVIKSHCDDIFTLQWCYNIIRIALKMMMYTGFFLCFFLKRTISVIMIVFYRKFWVTYVFSL